MRKLLVVLPLLSLMGADCGGSSGNCTVTKNAGTGVATITCPDGSSVEVAAGHNGTNCTVTKDAATGVTTIACADGTTATVEDGVDGQKGDKGDKGDTGDSGAPGVPGAVSLVKLDTELAGTNCANGGTKVTSGVDADGSGVLDASEVTQIRYICTPAGGSGGSGGTGGCTTLEGSYTVTNTLDWQNLVNSGCTVLTGDLIIAAPGLATLTPGAILTSIGGNLRAGGNALLGTFPFPELTTVGGYIDLSGNPALSAFTLSKVTTVAGRALPGCRGAFPYHDDGTGTCVLTGCAAGYHDGGDGQCVANGACSSGYAAGASGLCFGELVSVKGGTASGNDWSYAVVAPATSVTVADFKMDRTEVTVAHYSACVTAGACTAANTGGSCNAGVTGREYHPINCVDWSQATAFCAWAGKRLPAEVEWQWAASNGGTTVYPWGAEAFAEPWARSSVLSGKSSTAAVGLYPAGANEDGLQDLAGNVWEWTASDYSPGSVYKSIRGGSWNGGNEGCLRAAYRDGDDPSGRDDYQGFRCAQ